MHWRCFHGTNNTLVSAAADVCWRIWWTRTINFRPNKNNADQGIRVCGGTYPMQLHVEATGVAHRLPLRVAPPQGGGAGVAVGAAQAGAAGCGLLEVEQAGERDKVDIWMGNSLLLLIQIRERVWRHTYIRLKYSLMKLFLPFLNEWIGGCKCVFAQQW